MDDPTMRHLPAIVDAAPTPGAPHALTDIQARLGHASTATTAAYMNQLKSADNPYSDRLAALLGLE